METKKQTKSIPKEQPKCFVIMPISDTDGYKKGHFNRVYEDIFKPACQLSGYEAIRADDVKQTNLIHLDILKKLIESPLAICDLSSKNPNVMFELGLRQAFDKPTVLVQDENTTDIFDITPLRYTEYNSNLQYRDVLRYQKNISQAIDETIKSSKLKDGINSMVRLLSLTEPASLKDPSKFEESEMFSLILNEISGIKEQINRSSDSRRGLIYPPLNNPDRQVFARMKDSVNEVVRDYYSKRITKNEAIERLSEVESELNQPKYFINSKFTSAIKAVLKDISVAKGSVLDD